MINIKEFLTEELIDNINKENLEKLQDNELSLNSLKKALSEDASMNRKQRRTLLKVLKLNNKPRYKFNYR